MVLPFRDLRQLKDELDENSVTVVLFHDHGSRYVGKVYNDDWMRDRGFLTTEKSNARDLVEAHANLKLITATPFDLVSNVVHKMQEYKISQIPIVNGTGDFVGSLDESEIFYKVLEDNSVSEKPVSEVMGAPYPIVDATDDIKTVARHIDKANNAVLVKLGGDKYHIITRQDVIGALS